jgi:hypothetical protein
MHRSLSCSLLLLFLALSFSGCTRLGLAYRNLDLIIPWSLNSYLDMTTEQQQDFDALLNEHLSWHCRTQLPSYLDWLHRLHGMVQNNQVTPQGLQTQLDEAKQAIDVIAKEITPSTVKLLRELNDRQVKELYASLDKDMREKREKLLAPPLNKQIQERSERMEKRLSPWLGKLTAEQRQRIAAWSQSLGEQNRLLLENRARWQGELRLALAERHSAEFPTRIARLLQDRERLWSDEYRTAFARVEQAAIDLLVDLMRMADEHQRKRLLQRLNQVQLDFTGLKCLQET